MKKLVTQPTLEEQLEATNELNRELLDENDKLKKRIGKDEIIGEQEEIKEIILKEPTENKVKRITIEREYAEESK